MAPKRMRREVPDVPVGESNPEAVNLPIVVPVAVINDAVVLAVSTSPRVVLPAPAAPKAKRQRRVVESDDEDDVDDEEDEEDEEETEEDRAFINDGRVEKLEVDVAAIDASNIIVSADGGRPRRNRREPTRWEHPDAAQVMEKFCKKWNVTDEDLEDIMKEDIPECDDPEDASFREPENIDEVLSSTSDEEDDEDDDDNEDDEEETEFEESEHESDEDYDEEED
jgi:hypothetical protein